MNMMNEYKDTEGMPLEEFFFFFFFFKVVKMEFEENVKCIRRLN